MVPVLHLVLQILQTSATITNKECIMNDNIRKNLRELPGVDLLLENNSIRFLKKKYGTAIVTFSIRAVLESVRKKILEGKKIGSPEKIVVTVTEMVKELAEPSLKSVINATGIVLHTNLSRAPLGRTVLNSMEDVVSGYSNLEFNLNTARRGQRNDHISSLMGYITGAEDAVVVNNNAAAVLMCLTTFAKGKEVIVSRGELIEIGGSFRIPDIMKAGGAKMIEVGSTNRTRIADYEDAITTKTRILFKAHKSNYEIRGFSEEVEIKELADLAEKHNLLMIYDLGSGLLRKPEGLKLEQEPDVKSSLSDGADIITFSGDKLLGGPQAGIIVGKEKLIRKLSRSPMMRALRVGKLTMTALTAVISAYLKDEDLINKIPIFEMLSRTKEDLFSLAARIQKNLQEKGIDCDVVESKAQVGGGTLPGLEIDSYAVKLVNPGKDRKFAEKLFRKLLKAERPVLGILREGDLVFDVQSLFKEDVDQLIETVSHLYL